MGKQLAEEVQRQAKLMDDPIITEYVNRVGQNLARNSDAKVPFTFQVIDDPTLNAFALPGGFIFVQYGPDDRRRNGSGDGQRHGARDRARGRPAYDPTGLPGAGSQHRHVSR